MAMPVTMPGSDSGRSSVVWNRCLPGKWCRSSTSAAGTPSSTASTVADTATLRLLARACSISVLAKTRAYQSVVKPASGKVVTLLALNENRIRTPIGR